MANITCDCAGEIDMSQFPCSATKYGFPNKLIFQKPGGSLTVAGETPTLAEIQTGLADTGDDKLILIEAFTNGQRTESSRIEETGADTADGLTDVVALFMKIDGKIKLVNEYVLKHLLELNCFSRLKMWVVTDQGYIFGGTTGYRTSVFFPPLIMEGYGVADYVPVSLVYQHDLTKTDPAGQDDGFLTLVNTATT